MEGSGIENHADLVGEDLLGGTHAFQGIGVDDLAQLRHQKLVREYGKLNDKGPDLLDVLLTVPEQGCVRIVRDDPGFRNSCSMRA
jgi:hypothetical protein